MNKRSYLLVCLLFAIFQLQAQVIYVNQNATGANNGSSWANAYTDLQAAVDAANAGNQLWVAAGTYLPTKDQTGNANPADDRTKTFFFNKDLELYGGFLGTETSLSQRTCDTTQAAILSGNIGLPNDAADNTYHVVHTEFRTSNFLMDCFTITEGFSEATELDGAAWYNDGSNTGNSSNPTVQNCYFITNAAGNGGSFYNHGVNGGEASPTFNDCLFTKNAGEVGGAMQNNGSYGGTSSPIINRCTFLENIGGTGGAIYNYAESGTAAPVVTDSDFAMNSAVTEGGAIYNYGVGGFANSPITNCTFTGNAAGNLGGAILNLGFSGNASIVLTSSDFEGNQAPSGGAIHNFNSFATIDSCSFTANAAQIGGAIYNEGSQSQVASPDISNSRFVQNTAIDKGGAMFNNGLAGNASPSIVNCVFIANTAVDGGAISNDGTIGLSQTTVVNSVFSRNGASNGGGAIHNKANGGQCSTDYLNCSFSLNTANAGGAFFNEAANGGVNDPQLRNSILWGNTGGETVNAGATMTATYSLYPTIASVNGLVDGGNNIIQANPLFTNVANDDLTLQDSSPAINAGNSSFNTQPLDLAGDMRILGAAIEMGAFEHNPCPTFLYVDLDATGLNTGTSWANALVSFQTALEIAKACDADTIWVAEGTYFPSQTQGGNTAGPNDRQNTFFIDFDVVILGGFDGTEALESQRDFVNNVTILSGDLGTPGTTSDNAYHVIKTNLLSPAFELDGFTITAGNANTHPGFNGGGWHNMATAGNSSPTVRNVIFDANLTSIVGGGFYNYANTGTTAAPTFTACTFINNNRQALYNQSSTGGTAFTSIVGCHFENNGSAAIWNDGSGTMTLSILNSSFLNNSASSGGAIFNQPLSNGTFDVVIRGTSFTNNTSTQSGAAIATYGPNGSNGNNITIEIDDCIFDGNSTNSSNGGAFAITTFNSSPLTTTIKNTTFTNNYGANEGGAIHLYESTNTLNTLIEDCDFTSNSTIYRGGAIYAFKSSPVIRNCNFNNNTGTDGGAINVHSQVGLSIAPVIQNCLFEGNSVGDRGGAIFMYGHQANVSSFIQNSRFINNTSSSIGGAIGTFAYGNGGVTSPEITNCIFSRNSAVKGGAIHNNGSGNGNSSSIVTNCSFSDNSASDSGGAFYNYASFATAAPTITNSILWDNGDEVRVFGGSVTIAYSLVKGAALPMWTTDGGNNLLNLNPLFVSAATDDLHLQSSSPALNVGNNASLPVDVKDLDNDANTTELIDIDLDLLPRLFGIVDMGAYERQVISATGDIALDFTSKVYPTLLGADQVLTVESGSPQATTLRLIDGQGRLLKVLEFTGDTLVELGDLAAGVYFVQVGKEVHRVVRR